MPRLDSTRYTVLFAAGVSIVCALLVATAAVGLRSRQEANALLYKQKNVLLAASLVQAGERRTPTELQAIFDQRIKVRVVDLQSGQLLPEDKFDAKGYDQRKARNDPAMSRPAAPNDAQIMRLPKYGTVYQVAGPGGQVEQLVLPIEGMAMWGTVYGFLALDRDGNTVRGLTFYEQKETPGLGGEIGNPKWQALWVGRKAFDAHWQPQLKVIKGQAGPPTTDPHHIDGLSGATITSNGITRVVRFWLSSEGYAPFLKGLKNPPPGAPS
ncbi:MAG: Na(+)-translocating NADH-quinone reductase subunit C [Leptothrix sp. (in: Bacteria)]|nr:Na(+)-translocating NADH-quinone reductase subunit C [Leptothrix sp. (in: b-proteobacteria)]